jgi:2-polyprenyl-3-methyl-5-hydroxy-6-metoxy-1,4-benzoquinol methylase
MHLPATDPGWRSNIDAGCGSGCDSLAFLEKEYAVVSMDVFAEMVKATAMLTGQAALLRSFADVEFDREFDDIWACASLLHVPRRSPSSVFGRLTKALKAQGVVYLSFK